MQSPLLASDDGANAPSLSSGPAVAEESEFSRLIAQQSPFDAMGEQQFEEQGQLLNGGNYELLDAVDPEALAYGANVQNNTNNAVLVIPPRGPLITAIAGALSILHLCFVWASYASNTWAESRIRISVEWQEEYLPLLNDAKETTIRSTNLMSLLQDMVQSGNYVLLVLVWSVSLLLPCLFMILSPTFILADHTGPILYSNRTRFWSGRGLLETAMRWAFATFYVVLLLSLATSFLELQWTDTTIEAGNRARGPLAAYVAGISCAVALTVVLRSPPPKERMAGATQTAQELVDFTQPPPPQAFQHPWRPPSLEQEDEPAMTVLEEQTSSPPSPAEQHPEPPVAQNEPSSPSTPELVSEDGGGGGNEVVEQTLRRGLSFQQKFVAFQLGLLSVILWIPTFYLPALSLSYGGLATNFLAQPLLRLYIWEIGGAMWHQGIHFGTPVWILLLSGVILLLTTLVLPLVATCLAVLAWIGDGIWSAKCYSWLYALHPSLGGMVFSLSLLAMIHSITPFSTSLLDHESAGFCKEFHELSGETCLDVFARGLAGTWFYMAQSVVLEMFVVVTLRWCLVLLT